MDQRFRSSAVPPSARLGRARPVMLSSVVAVLLILTGCSTPVQRQAQPATATVRTASPRVTKLLVIVMENHSLKQMQSGMPYTFAQATTYGYASQYRAIRHPSLPNYVAILSGRPHGVSDDQNPSAHRLGGETVFGQAVRKGRSAKTYAEGMPGNCATHNGGDHYAVRHNPWAYFVGERKLCTSNDVPISRLGADIDRGTLPNAGLIIPNTCHDAHDCSLKTADAWFSSTMKKIYAGKDWKAGRLAVVLTADEDDRVSGNRVLTVVIHPSQHHRVVTTPLSHYSLTGLYDDALHVNRINNAKTAPSMAAAFHLPIN